MVADKIIALILRFVILFGLYSRVKTFDVEVTDMTITVQPLKRIEVKYEHVLLENFEDNKLNFWPKNSSATLDLTSLERPSSRRKNRHLHTTYHSLVSSRHPLLDLKGTLNIAIPSPQRNHIPLIDLSFLHNSKNKIFKSVSNNLLVKNKQVNFDGTSSIYSTVRTEPTLLSDESMILTTEINTMDRVQMAEDLLLFENFSKSLEQFERHLYQATFKKLLSISPPDREENGISFIQSALFLYLSLMAISTDVDVFTRGEIENCLNYNGSKMNKIKILRQVISWLPHTNRNMKFRWTSRLILNPETSVSRQFVDDSATVGLHVNRINDTKQPDVMSNTLNRIIEKDSGGTLHNTFDEEDMMKEICSILLTTMYIRPRWRSAPTVLNGTRLFYISESTQRSVRMIRINDIMKYAALDEWDSDAIEISYGIPNLSILLLIPRGYSLRNLSHIMRRANIRDITAKMSSIRVAAILPIYTLRMTLLLPDKLKTMGMSRLVEINNSSRCNEIRISHAAQRLMFWAEAGRNAFKDDGIEWDEDPNLEVLVNRPYLFYIRWKNMTLLNGNFVL